MVLSALHCMCLDESLEPFPFLRNAFMCTVVTQSLAPHHKRDFIYERPLTCQRERCAEDKARQIVEFCRSKF